MAAGTLATFIAMDRLAGELADQIAHAVIAGSLNSEQFARLGLAMRAASGLQKLFQDEIARQAGEPIAAQQN